MQNHPIQNIFSHSMKRKENKTSLHFVIHKDKFLKLTSESIGENRGLKSLQNISLHGLLIYGKFIKPSL